MSKESYKAEPLSLDFMNSDWDDYRGSGRHEDRLHNPDWLNEFLKRLDFENAGAPPKAILEDLIELRDLLWKVAETLAKDKAPVGKDIVKLNEFLTTSATHRQLVSREGRLHLELRALRRDWKWIVAEIAADFAELLASGDTVRLRICANEDCRWVFYDTSKSGSRRWCGEVCSVLLRVRRHRERQNAEPH